MLRVLMFAAPTALLLACDTNLQGGKLSVVDEEISESDARSIVDQVNLVSRSDIANVELIEVSTDLTVGERIEAIVDRWHAFWISQAPCNEVTFDGDVITVDFGELEDECVYAGETYSGVDRITLTQIADAEADLRVDHEWSAFTNGEVRIDGTTGVTWSLAGLKALDNVLTITNFVDQTVIDLEGHHTFERLDPDLPAREGGFEVNGDRSWDDGSGEWTASLNELQLMFDDASPFAGNVVITSPAGVQFTVVYSRVDDDTTRATVTGSMGELFVFEISPDGGATIVED
jgi:hypothetical protein